MSFACAKMPCTECISSAGPIPQLAPIKLAPWPAAKLAKSAGVTPIIERLTVSNVIVLQIGKPVVFAASIAAATSSFDDMVSIHNTSTPPSASALACSVNAATALLWVKAPNGSNNSPVGPIEPATTTRLPDALACTSDAWRASLAAATLSSVTRSCA